MVYTFFPKFARNKTYEILTSESFLQVHCVPITEYRCAKKIVTYLKQSVLPVHLLSEKNNSSVCYVTLPGE